MYINEYLAWKKSYTRNGTYPNYKRWVERFCEFTGKDENYILEDVSRFRAFLSEKGYAPRNIQYGLYITRDYLSYLVAMHGLNFPLKLFKVRQERANSHYAITQEEFEAIDALLSKNEPISLQRKLMLNMLYDTGVRGGELLDMRLSDLGNRTATIRNEKNHRNRMVGWSDKTQKLLDFYLPLRENLLCQEDHLFVSFKWKPTRKLTTRQLERIVIELRKKAGFEQPIRPHSFRHGFVHRKLDEGTPITTVSQMLGHSSTMNVMNYAQLTSLEMRRAWGITEQN